jgi:hypothetical protein
VPGAVSFSSPASVSSWTDAGTLLVSLFNSSSFWCRFLVSMLVDPTGSSALPEETQAFIKSIQSSRWPREDLTKFLPPILSKVADFVAEVPSSIYSRFADIGVLNIGRLWVLSPCQLRRWLSISKSQFRRVLSATFQCIPIMPSEKHIKRDYVYLVKSRSKLTINDWLQTATHTSDICQV